MAKKTAMPKSKAKTAYGLLSEIATLALEEPKRIHMGTWAWLSGSPEPPRGFPACRMVGCIGGWAEALTGAPAQSAGDVLGLSNYQQVQLFYPEGLGEPHEPQTPAYARAVAAHIRWFQQKYATQLKAKKV